MERGADLYIAWREFRKFLKKIKEQAKPEENKTNGLFSVRLDPACEDVRNGNPFTIAQPGLNPFNYREDPAREDPEDHSEENKMNGKEVTYYRRVDYSNGTPVEVFSRENEIRVKTPVLTNEEKSLREKMYKHSEEYFLKTSYGESETRLVLSDQEKNSRYY